MTIFIEALLPRQINFLEKKYESRIAFLEC